ncbi:Thermostable beta-glucosidase B [uncultured Roseburia sp.]|uniref:Glycoside hydrolase family 3 C-terminal domain-containing protein n=1 Tax=Brotonthovivens ammoniilytica TaxID=2981725 RepID=A0ABT2TG75_9FIRM|nr:glycoside hydrolase family 3 N-terminal domain-containing protein [Brotonthovivens ammoniilytica]MCU6761195.1 glycoside hydrolase family 3 C-terminal domain-containing protein [Brotonthovivens ammoniilytica]SCI21599.1 Thermostable beta-glucosidase B [uncultured Roseburia sp.]
MEPEEILGQLTLEEKAALLSGKTMWQTRDIKRLDIPSVFCADGPHGLRRQGKQGDYLGIRTSLPATCFPTASAVANSWDETLAEEIGTALGEEAVLQDVQILLGPGLNIKRNPLCGRNFEYFSEDPCLSGKMAAAYVRGIQKKGVYACIKHFAVNNQECRRMSVNAVVDERTLREIYLTGFEIAVKEGKAKAVMTSYNRVNGAYANENEHLLREILRKEWGFSGIVITDWGGSNDHVKGTKAGSNLEMPASGLSSAKELVEAVENGSLKEEVLDQRVLELLRAVLDLKSKKQKTGDLYSQKAHHRLARKAAAQSCVLLKNENHLLPLKIGCKAAVIGDFAFSPRYQGAGSSLVRPVLLDTPKDELFLSGLKTAWAHGYLRNGKSSRKLEQEALKAAAGADVVLYFFGLTEASESEALDRSHMRVPQNQIDLLYKLSEVNSHIVGILSGGSAVEAPWESCCEAILYGGLLGEAGGGAVADLITGRVNPSGKLSETYPVCYKDCPSYSYFPGTGKNSEYREGIYTGYRYYETAGIPVRYPFGFGLSYTDFAYSDLSLSQEGATFCLKNAGCFDGAETAQLYIGRKDSQIFRPAKELKGFQKVFLKAGETKQITLFFDDKTFRYWNVKTNSWEVEGGRYQIMIGSDVLDIRLMAELEVKGTTKLFPYQREEMENYYKGAAAQISKEEFECLLGYPVPDGVWQEPLERNDTVSQMIYARNRGARFVCRCLIRLINRRQRLGKPGLNILFIYNMTFRSMAKLTGGFINMEMAEGLVQIVNGQVLKGIRNVVSAFLRKQKTEKQYRKILEKGQGR